MKVIKSFLVQKEAEKVMMNPAYVCQSAKSIAEVLVETETDVEEFRKGIELGLKTIDPYITVTIRETVDRKTSNRENAVTLDVIISLEGFYSFKAH